MDDPREQGRYGESAAAQWFHGRNDADMGSRGLPIARIEYFEERNREILRTTNGRPREYSTTSRLSVRRDVRP